jgi:hypothetical protein
MGRGYAMMLQKEPVLLDQTRVAVCQSGIVFGGRFQVILGVVRILNEAGIVPDILTSRLAFSPDEVTAKYGKSFEANFRVLPRMPKLPPDFKIAWFNLVLNLYTSDYDLLVNSSNSLIALPK